MYDELEKAMLYYIIFENEEYLLDETNFEADRNKRIIKAINELKAEKKEVTILTIQSKIKANSHQVIEYLANLGEYVFGTDAETVYKQIMQLSKKRKIANLLVESVKEINEAEDIDIFSEQIVKQINNITNKTEKEKSFVQQVADTLEKIEKETLEEKDYSLYTGITDLDNMTCGLHKQELTIIGARPRGRKNNICIANSRTHSKKRCNNGSY